MKVIYKGSLSVLIYHSAPSGRNGHEYRFEKGIPTRILKEDEAYFKKKDGKSDFEIVKLLRPKAVKEDDK